MYKKKNFALGTLSSQLLIGGTSLVLQTGEGTLFPDTGSGNTFMAVIWGSGYATPQSDSSREIIVAYRSSGDTFTITRGQEGTSAKQWEINDNFMLTATAGVFDEYETAVNGKVPYTGASGNVTLGANTLSTTSGLISPKIYPSADSTTAFQINKADGTTNVLNVNTTSGNVGIGTTAPSAVLHLKAGTATASTAPLKFTSGVVNTVPEAGAIEFDGTDFFLTI